MLTAWATPYDENVPETVAKIHRQYEDKEKIMAAVQERFADIVAELGLQLDISKIFSDITAVCEQLRRHGKGDELYHYAVSRGEWLNGQIVAAECGFEFVDPLNPVVIDKHGQWMPKATRRLAEKIGLLKRTEQGVVIPGFYGRASTGGKFRPRLLSRGGSDITGAIVAVLTGAKVYDNWTDVAGFFTADPRVVPNAHKNDWMTYKELRELTFMGAKVFHEDAVAIVRSAGIPIHLRCTMTSDEPGTMIVLKLPEHVRRPIVTGIAGKNGFSQIVMEKYGMDDETGILSKAANVFARTNVGVNVSSSIDSLTFIVETKSFQPFQEHILGELERRFRPDDMRIEDEIALMCTVGEGMRDRPGTSARLDTSLAAANINIVLELQGGSQINIIRGVKEKDLQNAIRAAHDAFF